MRTYALAFAAVMLIFQLGFAQTKTDSMRVTKPKKPTAPKVFYGGTLGLNFGSYFRISAEPMVGYRVNPKFSVGAKFRYEYISDSRYTIDRTYHNFGASLFARYRVIPQIYLHAEPAYMSYQYDAGGYESPRDWVPFFFVGGGYVQRLGTNLYAYAEVLFDVLRDGNSPYEDWDPFVSVGVSVGF